MIENYSRVSLITDRYQAQGIAHGAVGYVIEAYDNGDYEVEFSRPDGTTYAQVVANSSELQVDEPRLITKPADVNLTAQEITYLSANRRRN